MINRGDEVEVEGFGWRGMVAGSVIRGQDGFQAALVAFPAPGTDLFLLPINVGVVGPEARKPEDHGWTRLVDEAK